MQANKNSQNKLEKNKMREFTKLWEYKHSDQDGVINKRTTISNKIVCRNKPILTA
jgi:hypothetical protein